MTTQELQQLLKREGYKDCSKDWDDVQWALTKRWTVVCSAKNELGVWGDSENALLYEEHPSSKFIDKVLTILGLKTNK